MTTHGFTGADLKALCNEASLALIEDISRKAEQEGLVPADIDLDALFVESEHFLAAQRVTVPSAMREVLFRVPDVKWDDIGGRVKLKEKLNDIIGLQTKEDLFAGLKI